MKYAIVSDIHANQQAWKAVLLDIRSMGVDKIISLGDIIGYGPSPVETLESMYETVDYFVLGNHDAALCGKIDTASFNTRAGDMISWTRQRVGDAALQFISDHPLTLAGIDFRCAHGDFADPGRFCYVFEPEDAMPSWNAVSEPLLFIGHTHYPCIIVLGKSGTPRMIKPQDFVLEDGKRFIVNVGSVGQPRDTDTRASYCLYDLDSRSVFWRKIPFDLDAYSKALDDAGIARDISPFLEFDPRASRPPLRELVPFNPPSRPVQNTPKVQYIGMLRKKVRKWKLFFYTTLGVIVSGAVLAVWIWLRYENRTLNTAGPEMSEIHAVDFPLGRNLLLFPNKPVAYGSSMPKWNVHLGNRYGQQVAWQLVEKEKNGFIMRSSSMESELSLTSAQVLAAPAMKFSMQAYVKKSSDFSGSIALALVLVQQRDLGKMNSASYGQTTFKTNRNFVVKEPNILRKNGWFLAKRTVILPARSYCLAFQIRGKFQGAVFVRDMRLERKK